MATSLSGCHLGIYKTLQKHVKEQKKNNDNQPPEQPPQCIQQGHDVLCLIFDIMTLMLCHSYALNQWKTVWTMFIKKDPGNPDLQRLCCIMLVEADWQLMLKWHSSYGFLPKAEHAKTLTLDQGGGQKGQSSINQALQQVAEMEINHLHQHPHIILFLDHLPLL